VSATPPGGVDRGLRRGVAVRELYRLGAEGGVASIGCQVARITCSLAVVSLAEVLGASSHTRRPSTSPGVLGSRRARLVGLRTRSSVTCSVVFERVALSESLTWAERVLARACLPMLCDHAEWRRAERDGVTVWEGRRCRRVGVERAELGLGGLQMQRSQRAAKPACGELDVRHGARCVARDARWPKGGVRAALMTEGGCVGNSG